MYYKHCHNNKISVPGNSSTEKTGLQVCTFIIWNVMITRLLMIFYLARQLTCPSTLSRVHFVHLVFNICQFLLQGHTFCKNPPITDLMTSLQKHTLIIVSAPSLYSSSSSSHNNKPVSFYHLNQSSVHPHHLSHPRSHRLIHRCSNRSVIFIST